MNAQNAGSPVFVGEERLAERQVDQHAAERADRADDPDRGAGDPPGPHQLRALVAAPGDGRQRLAAEDRRDHLVGRAVADAGQHEQER